LPRLLYHSSIPLLLSLHRVEQPVMNGAEQAARFILDMLS